VTTIKDVARQAGVSVTTVSRALNGHDDVNPETRRRIQEVADQLGYSPNIAARTLVSKRSRTLGLLLSALTRNSVKDNIVFEMLCGMNDRAAELEYDLVLFNTTPQKQRQKSYKALCKERGVDGVIMMGMRLDDPYLEEMLHASIPCVLIDIPIERKKNIGYVMTDNVQGAMEAVTHLIERGHRHIGMINGHAQAAVSIQRLDGYRQALGRHGIPFADRYVEDGGFSEDGGKDAAYRLLTSCPELTAIFCASDLMALGALQAIRALGKRVPEDISIIGFDNIVAAQYCTPALTTVNQDKYQMGYIAAATLIDMLEGRQVPRYRKMPAELIVRASTGPAPVRQN